MCNSLDFTILTMCIKTAHRRRNDFLIGEGQGIIYIGAFPFKFLQGYHTHKMIKLLG